MSSPPSTPKPRKRLRQFLTEPFTRSRSRSQSRSPSHSSQPLPQPDPRTSSTAARSNEDPGQFASSSQETPSADNATVGTPTTGPDASTPTWAGAAAGVPMILEPDDGGSRAKQTIHENSPPSDGSFHHALSNTAPVPDPMTPGVSTTPEHMGTASGLMVPSPEPEHGSPGRNLAGLGTQESTVALVPNKKSQNVAWNGLRGSLNTLRNVARVFPQLGSAVESLLSCLDGFEMAVQSRQDFEDLATELTELSESLKQHIDGSSSALWTDSTTGVVMAIEQQVAEIQDRLGRGSGGIRKASEDEEALVRNYRRIQAHFRLLQTNASMSIWRIVDEHLVNTRLESLKSVTDAAYDSSLSAVVSRRGCTEGTRTEVLDGLDNWLNDSNSSPIYWIDGMAGTGKTTIAWTFCERVENRKRLAASFFCTRSSAECKDMTKILPTIAYQLARYSFPFRSELCHILAQNPDIGSKNLSKQFEHLLRVPMKQVKDAMPEHVLVVIDALDECEYQDGVETILDMLLQYAPEVPLKFLITSRPEPEVYDKLIHSKSRNVVHLHEIKRSLVQRDIQLYLNEELKFVSPSPADVEQLVERAGTLFIYAATLVRYIRFGKRFADPRKRLQSVLSMTPEATKTHTHIDALYTAVLESALSHEEIEADEAEVIRAVLRTVLSTQEPISIETIATFTGIDDPERVVYALQPLRSVLHQSEETGLVSTLHASFPDFMFDSQRSGTYFCDIVEHSQLLAQRCLLVMKEQLRFNICDLTTSFVPDEKVEGIEERVKEMILPTLAYACRYWATHLSLAPRTDDLQSMLDEFLCHRLLFWMEVLTLRREMVFGVEGCITAKKWITKTGPTPPDLTLLVEDALNFVVSYTASPVAQSTPHIYISSLPFCPRSSTVYKHYWKRMQGLLDMRGSLMDSRDTAPLATWNVGSTAWSVAYSPDGSRIAIGDGDRNVTVRNAYDGTLVIGPLQGHTGTVNSVAYSPDGRYIASGSFDRTVRMWNANNGALSMEPFEGHAESVSSVAFSPNGGRIVSGSSDSTIRVWKADDGTLLLGPLRGHTRDITSVTYSPNGRLIASSSNDRTIRLWNPQDGSSVATFMGHRVHVTSVVFTPDSTRLVSTSLDTTIRVWDTSDGSPVISPFGGGESATMFAVVSPDGTRVASASHDRIVRVWNINDGSLVSGPFVGHTDSIFSLTYSPDGSRVISGSADKTIRVWNVRDNLFSSPSSSIAKALSRIHTIAFSSESTHLASNRDEDYVIRVWDVSDGSSTTGPLEARFFPSPLSILSPDSSYAAAISRDFQVQIINTANGSLAAGPFGFQRDTLSTILFSRNNTAVLMGFTDGSIKISPLPNQQQIPLNSFVGHSGEVKLLAESPDRTLIASYSENDNAIRMWRLLTPALEIPSCIDQSSDTPSPPDYSVLHEGWRITKDGWAVNSAEDLLLWIPPNIASAWCSPYASLVIIGAGTLEVPGQKLLVGDQWSKCYISE